MSEEYEKLTVYSDTDGTRYKLELNMSSQWVLARTDKSAKCGWSSGIVESLMMNNCVYEYDEQEDAQMQLDRRATANGWVVETDDKYRGYRKHKPEAE